MAEAIRLTRILPAPGRLGKSTLPIKENGPPEFLAGRFSFSP